MPRVSAATAAALFFVAPVFHSGLHGSGVAVFFFEEFLCPCNRGFKSDEWESWASRTLPLVRFGVRGEHFRRGSHNASYPDCISEKPGIGELYFNQVYLDNV